MVKETFVRLGESFTFECRHEQYRGCVHQILGSVTDAAGYYFRLEKLQTFKKKKYDFILFGFGPWEEYQDYVLLEDSYFEGLTACDSKFYELGTWIGKDFLLIPDKVKEFAVRKTRLFYESLETEKTDLQRSKNAQFTQAL